VVAFFRRTGIDGPLARKYKCKDQRAQEFDGVTGLNLIIDYLTYVFYSGLWRCSNPASWERVKAAGS